MSVNITVNGKYSKHRHSHRLLDDPQKVRKAEEQERRKLRLLQVREESKKLAKKIREEVNEEKRKELQKLQAIKEQELECWRQHALDRKGEEYRSAIFQVGTAHNAARVENAQKAKKQQQRQQGTYKDFKKQIAARKLNQESVQFDGETSCPCQQITQCVNKQFNCTCVQTDDLNKNNPKETHKRKRDSCLSSSESECEDERYKEQTTLPHSSFSFSSSCDSSTSSFINNRTTETSMFVPTNSKCLIKTPAVCLDVEVGSEDSITISAPAEIKDKHVKYNRQFSSVIRVSPRKGRKHVEKATENPSKQSSTTASRASDVNVLSSEGNKTLLRGSQSKQTLALNTATTKEKRFTLISDLVKRHQQQESNILPEDQVKLVPSCPPVAQSITVSGTPHLSPRKQIRGTTVKSPAPRSHSPRKMSAVSKSSKTTVDHSQPTTTFTAMTKTNTAVQSTNSSSGRVQFFDYNSKLSKERDQAASVVSVQRQKDQTQPTAMEEAELEKQRTKERQLEVLKKCQQMEERSQKALEREQVRRDCNELTEKLEALTKEYPSQVPTNENQQHLFVDKQLRKEGKMNTALEKILNRPVIITCPEVNKPARNEVKTTTTSQIHRVLDNEINVGAINNLLADDVSSDSCCSILLGYVDDQSKLVKQDLQNASNIDNNQNQTKQERLRNLLKRLNELRNSLLQELKQESESKVENQCKEKSQVFSKEGNLRHAIDSISEMRKEREEILTNENARVRKPLKEREREIEAKEALLEEKIRELYELQKEQKRQKPKKDLGCNKVKENEESSSSNNKNEGEQDSSNDKENVICATTEKPVEIIITVRGENKNVKIPQKPRKKMITRKSPSVLSTLIRSPQPKIAMVKKHIPKKKIQSTSLQEKGVLKRQNSYDSNSTSYMSLPSQLPTQISALAERIVKENQQPTLTPVPTQKQINSPKISSTEAQNQPESELSLETSDDTVSFNQPARINPLIAQYIQRLLGMSRNAVQKLGVSSSDIETPNSTILNTPTNINNSDTLISNQRLIDIHNFIEENKSFIKDLEQSIRSQDNASLENSMKMFDDIWRKRLKTHIQNPTNKKTQNKTVVKEKIQTRELKKSATQDNTKKPSLKYKKTNEDIKCGIQKASKDNEESPENKLLPSISQGKGSKTCSNHLLDNFNKNSHHYCADKEISNSLKKSKRPIEKIDKAIDTRLSSDSQKTEPDSQIARYAKLTENCTHRIAELTELINRVREEKQRLLEVTLSSVSDNGRQSTEYLELPEGKSITHNDANDHTQVNSTSTEEATQNKQSCSTDTLYEIPKLSSADKNKQITSSLDSGFAESRPLTALENRIDQEPISQTSSENTMSQAVRKMKPPPTLKRFSPQLPEDELAHELSTILEVDTPGTSRINTAVGQSIDERENNFDSGVTQQPVKFPTFEQYIKQLDLDITQLDPEKSIQLRQEFASFLECLQMNLSLGGPQQYKEFPSINAYLEKFTEGDRLGETMFESLAQLHISNVYPRNFPALREYIKCNASKTSSDEQKLLDTESLENITEERTNPNTDNETVSIDIEEELKRRKILKNSFRYMKENQQICSPIANIDAAFYQEIIEKESGREKLSSSYNTIDKLKFDMKKMTQQLSGRNRNQNSQYFQFLSSTTNSANTSTLVNSALQAASLDESSKDNNGQSLNLRDFLTRELLKHANISGSITSSSSDESLRSHFLHSIIKSLTPRTPGMTSRSGHQTLDRQKTSTPVPVTSSQIHSNSSSHVNTSPTQLFSGESRISSVRYQDRSVRFFTSDSGNGDHSSE